MAREVLRVGTPRSRTKRRPADRLDKAFHCAGPSRGCGLARHPFAHPVRRAALCLWSRRSRRGRIGMRRREGGNVRRTARESVRAVTASEHGRRSHAGLERFSDAFFKGARTRALAPSQIPRRGERILSTEPCSPSSARPCPFNRPPFTRRARHCFPECSYRLNSPRIDNVTSIFTIQFQANRICSKLIPASESFPKAA